MKLLFLLLCISSLSIGTPVDSVTSLYSCLKENDICSLTQDIGFGETETWGDPLAFSGTLQGNRFTFRISLKSPLFKSLTEATIENIKINIIGNFRTNDPDPVSIIARKGINCTINQLAIFGNDFQIRSSNAIGFLFGEYSGSLAINQTSIRIDNIDINSESTKYGGLIGKINESKGGYILNSFINATSLSFNGNNVNYTSYCGGLVGHASNSVVDRWDYYLDSNYVHINEITLQGNVIYGGIIGYGISVSIILSFVIINKISIYTNNIVISTDSIPDFNYYGCFAGYLINSQVDDSYIYYQNIIGPKYSPIVFGGFIGRSDHILVSNSFTRIDNLNIKRNSTGDEFNEYIGLFTGIAVHISTMRYYMDVYDNYEYGIIKLILDESIPKFDYNQYNGLHGGNYSLMLLYDITEIQESYFTPETIEIFFPYFSFEYTKHWRFISPGRYPGLIGLPEYTYDETLNYFIEPEDEESLKSWDLNIWNIYNGGIYPILKFSIDNCTDQSRKEEGDCFNNKLLPFSVCENDNDICNTAFNLSGICSNKICRVSCNNQSVCDELNWDLYCYHKKDSELGICINCPDENRFDNICNNNERKCKFQSDCLEEEICLWSYLEEDFYCQRSLKCDDIGNECRMANGRKGICSDKLECRPPCTKQYQCYDQHPQLLCLTSYNNNNKEIGYCETNCPDNITVSNYCFNLDRSCDITSDCYNNETCFDYKCSPLVPCEIEIENENEKEIIYDYECEYNIDLKGICYNNYCRHNCSENDQYDCYYHQTDFQCKEIYDNKTLNSSDERIYKICDFCDIPPALFLESYGVCSNPIHSCHFTSDCFTNETCDKLLCQIGLYCENDGDECIFNDNSNGKCYNHICRPSCTSNKDCYENHAVDLECSNNVCIPCSIDHKIGNYCIPDRKDCILSSECEQYEICIDKKCQPELPCHMIQYDNSDGAECEYRPNISGSCYFDRCYPNCTLNSDCFSFSSDLACGKDVWNCRKCNTIYEQTVCNHINVSSCIKMNLLLILFLILFLII